MITSAVAVHTPLLFPFAAVAVKVYVPAGKLVDDTTTLLLLVITTVDPTLLVTTIDPLDCPKHVALVATPLTATAG